jgi:RHS repeat-associated protein
VPQVALERDGNNALLRRYIYGMRRVSMTTGGSTYYYAYDALGSVTNVTSATGASEWTYSYEPFGASRTDTKNDPNAPTNLMKFAGEYFDASGSYNLRAREYVPGDGRFLELDPSSTETDSPVLSSYVYGADRPTVMVDPSGATYHPINTGQLFAAYATSPCTRQLQSALGSGSASGPFIHGPGRPGGRNLVCRNWSSNLKLGLLTIDSRVNGSVAFGFRLSAYGQSLFSGTVQAYGIIGRDKHVVAAYSKIGYGHNVGGVLPDYFFHAGFPGFKPGQRFDVDLEIRGPSSQGPGLEIATIAGSCLVV